MPAEGTPQGETTPAAPSDPNATPTPPAAAPASVGQPAQVSVDAEALSRQLEEERKARQKIEMERNQLRNQREEEERTRLEEENRYKDLYEKERARLAEIEADKEAQRLRSFRQSIIESYPDEKTRQAALKLIESNEGNLVWQEGATEDQAKQQITSQLDNLRSVVGATVTPQPDAEDLNPSPSRIDGAKPTASEKSLRELEAELENKMKGRGY